MAELASGAVSSLLGLLRNEALLLSSVGSDVEFIKEEMESMHSFLEHLARTAPPAGGHDEQVRTWMNQVRDLAHDCSNCIDFYLRRDDPAVYRAGGRRRRYLWWASWLLQKMIIQHNAAIRLRELKERARDVGNRRMRYGVEIPRKEAVSAVALPSQDALSLQGGEEEEEEREVAVVANSSVDPYQRPLERPCLLEDYCAEKLDNWLELQAETENITSIAIVAPDGGTNDASTITPESLTLATTNFTCNVCINLSKLHHAWDVPMLSWEILTYILREFDDRNVGEGASCAQAAYRYKWGIKNEILNIIDDDDINKKIEEIKSKIVQVDEGKIGGGMDRKKLGEENKSLGILLHVLKLRQSALINWADLSSSEEYMVQAAAMLKIQMEAGESKTKIRLHDTQYIDILRKVFPESSRPQLGGATAGGEDHINEIIMPFMKNINEIIHNHKITLDIISKVLPSPRQQLLTANSASTSTTDDQVITSSAIASTQERKGISVEFQTSSAIDAATKETKEKMDKISSRIKYMMIIKGIVDKIKPHLENKKALIILQDDRDYVSIKEDKYDAFPWEETINALNLLGCAPGSAVVVSTKNIQKATEFCNPPGEPITCSLAGFYLDIVLPLTQQQIGGYDPWILRQILDKCHPHEFCMKMLAYALYANPKRSNEELHKLHDDLPVTQNTFGGKAKRMIRFSYKDLPREYKTCLLYLAIFPQGHIIRRSTLIGRWVTEGLITKQDWRTAVVYAERCFDALIKRGLVLPCDIGAAGKVKSCMVGYEVHGFITKVATKENIMDARLSDLWARHFSIFSGLRLRTSDSIDKFVQKLPNYSPQLPLLKVLDLEGTNCFDKEFLSMLIGEHVYDLQFRAEKNMDPENPTPIDMDLDPPGEDGNNNSQEGVPEFPPNDMSKETDTGDKGSKGDGRDKHNSHGKKCITENSVNDPLSQGAFVLHSVSSPISKDKIGKPVTPLHSSKRSAAVADQNSLERASKLKAKINLDGSPVEGNFQPTSVAISDLSSSVGISLGSSLVSVMGAVFGSKSGEGQVLEGEELGSDDSDSENNWEENLLSINLPVESDDDCTLQGLRSSGRGSFTHKNRSFP